ncbi:NAD-dependent epimerase/dehydratase [Hymenobacter roseosalivarius DSM 11622]|uniref:NAD-dependent epimerase/dehydratase n=1 Tax=Hymenobacter roseosalivarius DSM 11622 TaxID=645990 RepID=A0A1W1UKJ8_9BACT|nr:SDR family oxidoreductase [Hymenobacter roseosalivarius]SMB81572.1 NAD-dependent epimerase/dehydratase [Hymenobacter roseosalivarius DSM 11622]
MYEIPFHDQPLDNLTFLVTGGAGFIGSNLVEYLLKYGAGRVRVLDNYSNGFRKNMRLFEGHPALEVIEGDIRDPQVCRTACRGANVVLHQAALGSVPRSINDPITSNDVNVGGFVNMLVAAKEANVQRFVYAASSSTYGDSPHLPKVEDRIGKPLSPYAVTKYANELYADVFGKTYGMPIIGLRYFNIFGPRQDPNGAYAAVIPLFIDAVLQGKAPRMNGDGGQTRDFTFVENCVQANIKAALTANPAALNEVYNIAVADRTSLNDLFNILNEEAGSDITPEYGPDRPGDIRDSLADISKAKNLLGYDPQIRIREGLQKTLAWFKSNQTFIRESN